MITIILAYYENPTIFARQLEEWQSYAPAVKKEFCAIVVDDGSPTAPLKAPIREVGFPVTLFRIKQNIPWNIPGARNLGMKMAADGLCLLTDMDHVLLADDAERLINKELCTEYYYCMARQWSDGRVLNPHGNSYVLEKSLYWKIGGTDEDFSGWWGAGEGVFRGNLQHAAQRIDLPDVFLTHFGRSTIADASTTEWGRRDSKYNYAKNPALAAKRAPYVPERPIRFEWERVR